MNIAEQMTTDAVVRRYILKAISLPVVVAQPENRQQVGPFYVGVVCQTQSLMVHMKEKEKPSLH